MFDDIRDQLLARLPELKEQQVKGACEVLQLFPLTGRVSRKDKEKMMKNRDIAAPLAAGP